MRKLCLYIIIVFTAFNSVTVNQFSKLPLLFIHYVEHLQQDHNLSFFGFIDMHYFGDDINDNDDQKDKQLPLKDFNISSIQIYTIPENTSFVFNSFQFLQVRKAILIRDEFYPEQVISSLFRPPKGVA